MTAPETPDAGAEVQEYLKAQAEEYGRFVAAQDITHDGGLAYAAGQPVPVSNVVRYGYLANGLVITAEQAAKDREAATAKAEEERAAAERDALAAHRAALKDLGIPRQRADGEPAGNASTEEWRIYAISKGATAEQVADLSRNELREQFGTEE